MHWLAFLPPGLLVPPASGNFNTKRYVLRSILHIPVSFPPIGNDGGGLPGGFFGMDNYLLHETLQND